jgi:hypothetical protein
MQPPAISPEAIIAGASAIAAIVSAIYAWRSTQVAREALELARSDHREKHSGLSAYLIDGKSWDTEAGQRCVAFACTVSNTASAPLSVPRVELHLHVVNSDRGMSRLVLQPDPTAVPMPWQSTPLLPPINLESRSTASGWVRYVLPPRVVEHMTVDKYEVVFLASTGERTSVEQYLLQWISNAPRKA